MKKSVLILLFLLFLVGCGEEEVFPDGPEMLPGIYEGVYYDSFGGQDDNATAIVKFINRNTYKISFGGSKLDIEIRIEEIIDNSNVYFEVIGRNTCNGNPNTFVIYDKGVSPHIALSCCMKYTSNWGFGVKEFTERFEGSRPL